MRRKDLDRALFRGSPSQIETTLIAYWAAKPDLREILTSLRIVDNARRLEVLEILQRAIPEAAAQMQRLQPSITPRTPPAPSPAPPSLKRPPPQSQAQQNTALLQAMLRTKT